MLYLKTWLLFESKMKNKGLKGKDPFVFVRYGGLDVKPQRGYTTTDKTFHSPPANNGFYAMPKIAQELFLLGGLPAFQPSTIGKKSDNWIKTLRLIKKEFRKDSGYIWHHLGQHLKPYQIVATNGSWVKSSMDDWRFTFSKESIKLRSGDKSNFNEPGAVNNTRGVAGFYSKDHFEVFFDEKV
jgi:hypothetical protein